MTEIAGTYLFSWGVGSLTVFAPQGIGVFETLAAGLLEATSGLGGGAALVAGFRLVVLLADLTAWAACRVFRAWLGGTDGGTAAP